MAFWIDIVVNVLLASEITYTSGSHPFFFFFFFLYGGLISSPVKEEKRDCCAFFFLVEIKIILND